MSDRDFNGLELEVAGVKMRLEKKKDRYRDCLGKIDLYYPYPGYPAALMTDVGKFCSGCPLAKLCTILALKPDGCSPGKESNKV